MNIHFPFYVAAGVVALGIVILSTAHGPSSAEAQAERELEAEERAEAFSGEAD
jgi:hypothetical protein